MNCKWLQGLTPVAVAVALVVGPSHLWATSLSPGGSVTPSVVSSTGVSAGATILADTGWLSSNTVDGSGMVREIVVSGDTNNPKGGLDFIYQLLNTSTTSGVNLAGMDAFFFGKYGTDVIAANPGVSSFTNGSNSFGTPGPGGNDPTNATRGNNGDQVAFLFGTGGSGTLTPGSYSDLLLVRTDAPNFAPGIIDFFDGGTSDHLNGFDPAPPSATPEPSSAVLLGGCLAFLGAFGVWQHGRKAVPVLC